MTEPPRQLTKSPTLSDVSGPATQTKGSSASGAAIQLINDRQAKPGRVLSTELVIRESCGSRQRCHDASDDG